MRFYFYLFILSASPLLMFADTSLKGRITDSAKHEPLIGAFVTVEGTSIGTVTNIDGFFELKDVPAGRHNIRFHYMGYKDRVDTLEFPVATGEYQAVMQPDDGDMEEVTVSTTRSSRTIEDVPTRIELIAKDELDEKANMKPGDIKMLLSESTGIQTLQTSATSGNTGIRIEGLDGRYTQVLKDGFPLYAGFSGGLGLLQTPPLDLKRVEIIKGASSTLYGGGAIAGLVNLISKTPSKETELRALVNGTTAGGFDANVFYGQLYGKAGMTLYAGFNIAKPYAPDNVPFTAIPGYHRYTVSPKFFWYPDAKTDVMIGFNAMFEDRLGGDIHYILGQHDSAHTYYEYDQTQRANTEAEVRRHFDNGGILTLRNSLDHFDRVINTNGYSFNGTQTATFSELNYSVHDNNLEWVLGLNLFSDKFAEVKETPTPLRDYLLVTYGAFMQNTWDISRKWIVEDGLRIDYVEKYGGVVLPRVSLLYKINPSLSSRLGGGLGYKAPTIFTEESERLIYRNVLPVGPDSNKLERSYGFNWDANYRSAFADGKITFSANELLFYTHIDHPLLLEPVGNGYYKFSNILPRIDAYGAETNIKLGYKNLKLFLGYTYTHSQIHYGDVYRESPLTPRHHTNSVLMYELDRKLKIGLEAYYYSPQRLSDGSTGRDYWLCGLMAERIWKHWSVYINFENMLDSRQTRFDTIYTGSVTDPQFRDIYAPLDGFVANGGLKVNL